MGASVEDTSKKGAGEEDEDVDDQTNQGDAGDDGGDNEGNEGGNGKTGGAGKSFSQDQVKRMMTREKNQGRNSVFNELGIKPGDTKQIEAIKAYIRSQKTDEQIAAEKDQESKEAVAEANQRAMIAEAKAEAMMLGVKSQFVDDAVTLAIAKVGAEVDGDKSDIKTALGELKTKYPVWFESGNGDDEKKTGQKGTGSSVKTGNKGKNTGGTDGKSLGARLAAQRKGSSSRKSFWSN